MRMRVGTVVTILALVQGAMPRPAAADDPPPRGPVSVLVVASQPLQLPKQEYERLRKEAQAAKAVFEREMKDLEKQYGGNTKKWPLELREGAQRKALASNELLAVPAYANPKPKDLEDTVENIQKSFAGVGLASKKGYLQVVESKDDAGLIVEVVGRTGGSKLVRSNKYMSIAVRPGPRLPPRALEKLPLLWAEEIDFAVPIHHPSAAEPYLQFQAWDVERWRDVADRVSWTVNQLVKENYDLFVPAKAGR